MNGKKLIVVLFAFTLLVAGWFAVSRTSKVATYNDYYQCIKAGGTTIEPNPPTCFHPNGTNITPGERIIKR